MSEPDRETVIVDRGGSGAGAIIGVVVVVALLLIGYLYLHLGVLYLLFTRGYDADGEPAFADEAIRLARLLDRLLPGQPEVPALLALFLFQHSRRAARRDDAVEVPLQHGDHA